MNTNPLEIQLQQLEAPPPDPAARERARRAALEEFQRMGEKPTIHARPSRWNPRSAWWGGLAAASVAVVGVAIYWLSPPAERTVKLEEASSVARQNTQSVAADAGQSVPLVDAPKLDMPSPSQPLQKDRRAMSPPPLPLPPIARELPATAVAEVQDALASPAAAAPAGAGNNSLQETVVTDSRLTARLGGQLIRARPEAPAENRDRFQHFDVNPVKRASEEPVSTFSADVDTASYSFVRRQLNEGVLPPADAVRVEEMINYFQYAWPLPASRDTPFQPTITVTDSPWGEGHKLVHIGIKGYEVPANRRPDVNLVLLLDVSGSMNSPDKLPLAQRSMALLLDSLKPSDTVAIVVYAGAAGQVLAPTPVREKQAILQALNSLQPGGSTAGAEGIQLAYQLAERNFRRDGVNRILLATDGDFNVGITDREALKSYVERERNKGVYLSVLGFGEGNYRDEMAQTLAQNGNGVAAYIDTLNEARKVLVEQAGATLFTIAKDVKLQVEFNPATVAEYRLVGYESRALNREDFNNDKVDAGDIGAGHTVTAIYEITPVGSAARLIDDSRYEAVSRDDLQRSARTGEYGFLRIRYKLPDSTRSRLIETPIRVGTDVPARLRQDVQFSTAVAGFAQLLRGGRYTGSLTFEDVLREAQAARGEDEFGYRAEFVQLVRRAMQARGIQ